MQSTGLAVSELNEAHGPENVKSLISPAWAMQWSRLRCEVKTTGEKGRMVILGLWIRFLASAPEPAARAPQCLGNVSFLPVKLIMALTADERREMGAGSQQRKLAAPWPCHLEHSQGQEPCYQSTQLLSKSHFWKWWSLLSLTTFKVLLGLNTGIQFFGHLLYSRNYVHTTSVNPHEGCINIDIISPTPHFTDDVIKLQKWRQDLTPSSSANLVWINQHWTDQILLHSLY